MTSPLHRALGGAICLSLGACDPPGRVDPAANLTDNVVTTSDGRRTPSAEPREDDQAPVSGAADQEISMPEPDVTPTPPRAKPPAPAPRREILPSPIQPPAEVDPVLPDPGDEVPR